MSYVTSYKSPADLKYLENEPRPSWVFDLESRIIWWANQAGLDFWKAASLEDLQSRDFKGDSNTVVDRLNTVFHSTPKGQVSRESWTYYPLDEPVSTIADHMFVDIEDNRSAVLIQIEHIHPSDRDAQGLRLIEATRYTSVMVSMFSKSGDLLVENPAAIAFRTRHRSGDSPHPESPSRVQ